MSFPSPVTKVVCAGLCLSVPVCAGLCRFVPVCAGLCRFVPVCAGLCRFVQFCAVMCLFVGAEIAPFVCGGTCSKAPFPPEKTSGFFPGL